MITLNTNFMDAMIREMGVSEIQKGLSAGQPFGFLPGHNTISKLKTSKMNKDRRNRIQAIIDDLEALKERIEIIKDEEQEYADKMPDNLQDSEKHEKAEEAAGEIEEAYDSLDSAISSLENARDN